MIISCVTYSESVTLQKCYVPAIVDRENVKRMLTWMMSHSSVSNGTVCDAQLLINQAAAASACCCG